MITRFTLGLGIPKKEGVWKVKREERCVGILAIVCGFLRTLVDFGDGGRFFGRLILKEIWRTVWD